MAKKKAKKSYSAFLARVYSIELRAKKIYVYYEWKKAASNSWSRTDANGKPFSWTVPDTELGNAGYDKLIKQIDESEITQEENGAKIDPPVDFEVTMVQEDRGEFKDEYSWKFIKRLTPLPVKEEDDLFDWSNTQ